MPPLRIFVPARAAGNLARRLTQAAPDATFAASAPRGELDVAELRCLDIHFSGTSVRSRSPYAFPFHDDALRDEFLGSPHLIPCVDWLVLGGSLDRLAKFAAEQLATTGRKAIEITPFHCLTGTVSQNPEIGDSRLIVARKTANYNQEHWERSEERLLALPEERWCELGANTTDFYPLFAPHIRRLLVRPPRLILDAGCGLGQTARSLALAFPEARVIAFDVSPQAIGVARRAFDLQNLEFRAASLDDDLGLAPASVDLVVSANAFMYAHDQSAFADKLFTLLAPDGAVINKCRMAASHRFWDFPRSLLLPTVYQLEAADWALAASRHGLATEILPVPGGLGMESLYFYAGKIRDFVEAVERIKDGYRQNPPTEYGCHHSHALIVHCARASDNARTLAPSESHPEATARAVSSFVTAPDELRQAAVIAWLACFSSLHPFAEAADFIRACLPGAAGIVDAVFNPQTLAHLAKR